MSPKTATIARIIVTFLITGFLSGAATLIFGGGFLPGLLFGVAISILTKGKSLKAGKSPYWMVASAAAGYWIMSTLLFLLGAMLSGSMRESEIFVDPKFLGLLFFSSWIVSTMLLAQLKKGFQIFSKFTVFLGGLLCGLLAVMLILITHQFYFYGSVGVAAMIWQVIVGSILVYQISKSEVTN